MKKLPTVNLTVVENAEKMPRWGQYRKLFTLIEQLVGYNDVDGSRHSFGHTEHFSLLQGYRGQRHVVLNKANGDVVFLDHAVNALGGVQLDAYVPEGSHTYKTLLKAERVDSALTPAKPTSTEKDVNMQVHVKTESIREIPKTGIIVDFIKALDKQAGYSDRNNQPVVFGEVAFFRAMVGFRNHKWIELVPESADPKAIVFLTVVDGNIIETDDPRINGAGHMVARITRTLKEEIPEPPRADLAKRFRDSEGVVGKALGGKNIDELSDELGYDLTFYSAADCKSLTTLFGGAWIREVLRIASEQKLKGQFIVRLVEGYECVDGMKEGNRFDGAYFETDKASTDGVYRLHLSDGKMRPVDNKLESIKVIKSVRITHQESVTPADENETDVPYVKHIPMMGNSELILTMTTDRQEAFDQVVSMFGGKVWAALDRLFMSRCDLYTARVELGQGTSATTLYMRLTDVDGNCSNYCFIDTIFAPMEQDCLTEVMFDMTVEMKHRNKIETRAPGSVALRPQDVFNNKLEYLYSEVLLRANRKIEVELGVNDVDGMTYLQSIDNGRFWSELFDELHYEGMLDGAIVSTQITYRGGCVAVRVLYKNHTFFYHYNNSLQRVNEDLDHAEFTMTVRVMNEPKRKPFGMADVGKRFFGNRNAHRPFGAGVREVSSTQEIRRELEKAEADAESQTWIPQMNQFVKVEGMQGTYVIADYDDYADMFVVRLADACRRERETKLSPDSASLRVPGNVLRPIVLKY
jgi:hypothetical protein